MDIKKILESLDQLSEATKETPTGKIHKAEPGGYGRKFDTDEEGDEDKKDKKKKAEPAEKRGRGRPPKEGGESDKKSKEIGQSTKALQSFMVGNLPKGKLPGKATTKHTLKDWIEIVKENQNVSVEPLKQQSSVVKKNGEVVAQVDDPNLARQIQQGLSSGKMSISGEQGMDEAASYKPSGRVRTQEIYDKEGNRLGGIIIDYDLDPDHWEAFTITKTGQLGKRQKFKDTGEAIRWVRSNSFMSSQSPVKEEGVMESLGDSNTQDIIIDTVERLFRKNEISDYGALEAIRQGVKHYFTKPNATTESAIEGILNILDKRMSKSGNYVDLGRFKEALRQGVAHKLKKQGVAEGQLDELKKSTVKSYADKKQAELDDVPPMPLKKPARSKAEIEKDAKGMMGALSRLSGKKPTSEGVAEGWKEKVGAAALAGSITLGSPAQANSIAQGLGRGMTSAAGSSVVDKNRNAEDEEFTKQIPDEKDREIYLKALKQIKHSRALAYSSPAMTGANLARERNFKKLKQQIAEKYNIPMSVKEQGVAEGSSDDSEAKAAYMHGLRHGSEGIGNNMDRAKAEWGDNFKHYNAGFLKGRNKKAKSLKAVGQGYGKRQQGVSEGSDEYGFHTSVSKGKFLPSKYGQDENNLYLHDLMNVSGDGSGPQLVTINDKRIATELAAMYGGYVEKTGMGTYRVYQPRGARQTTKKPEQQGVAEGFLNEGQYEMMMSNGQVKKFIAKDDADAKRIAKGHGAKSVIRLKGGVPAGKVTEQGVAEGSDGNFKSGDQVYHSGRKEIGTFLDYDDRNTTINNNAWVDFDGEELMVSLDRLSKVQQGVAEGSEEKPPRMTHTCEKCGKKWQLQHHCKGAPNKKQGVSEGSDELYQNAIRSYTELVAHNCIAGGSDYIYGVRGFDSEMFGVDPKQAQKDFDRLFPQYLKKLQDGEQGVAEGYILKKTNVDKYMEPGDPDEYTQDINIKDTDYEIINNKTGQVVGTASWTTNDFMGPGALKITMKNGATRWLDIWASEKGNPQSAFNRFVKDPKTAKKYKEQGVAEADMPTDQGDVGAGLGAGRSQTTLEDTNSSIFKGTQLAEASRK